MINFCIVGIPCSGSTALAMAIEKSTGYKCFIDPFHPDVTNWEKNIPDESLFSRTKYLQGRHSYDFFKTCPYIDADKSNDDVMSFCKNFVRILIYPENIYNTAIKFCICEYYDCWTIWDLEHCDKFGHEDITINKKRYDEVVKFLSKETKKFINSMDLYSRAITDIDLFNENKRNDIIKLISDMIGPIDQELFNKELVKYDMPHVYIENILEISNRC